MGLTRPKVAQLEKTAKIKDKHFWASMVKSSTRLGACYALYLGMIPLAAILLGVAELIGIVEEMV